MTVYSVWKDLIKPTIFAYIIVCAILFEIVGGYYLYANYTIALDFFYSMQPHYAVQTELYDGSAKRVDKKTFDKLLNYISVEIGKLLAQKKDVVD